MTDVKCARCGEPAQGYAYIDGERYCHGDQEKPTCYMRESWERSDATIKAMIQRMENPPWWERAMMAFGTGLTAMVSPAARWLIGVFGRWTLWVVGGLNAAWVAYTFTVDASGWFGALRVAVGMWLGGLLGHSAFLVITMVRGRRQLQDLPGTDE